MATSTQPVALPRHWTLISAGALTFLLTFALRVRGVSRHFWLLEDQIRDWTIALGPITTLPFVGPPTHVHGYTIGPAFYWILWGIRVVIGPWFHNLPHAGGIGQALLQSAVDALLLLAVWKRTGSIWFGLTTVVLLVSAPFDFALSPIIWNPVVGSILAKAAIALIVLDWPRGSDVRVGITAAIAWSAVHAYTGAIFVALSVFTALLIEPGLQRDGRTLSKRALVIAGVVAILQLPYALHQISTGFSDSGMAAVTSSLAGTLSGEESFRLARSASFYVDALARIQAVPGSIRIWGLLLILFAAVVAIQYRQDPALVTLLVLPQALTIFGYALWFADLDVYYYLSLMPTAVLTILFAAARLVPPRASHTAGIVFLAGALFLVPARMRSAATMFKMPEYQALATGSQEIIKRRQPMQSIRSTFDLPPTSDAEAIFRMLGGRIDRRAPWRALIFPDGRVEYLQFPGREL